MTNNEQSRRDRMGNSGLNEILVTFFAFAVACGLGYLFFRSTPSSSNKGEVYNPSSQGGHTLPTPEIEICFAAVVKADQFLDLERLASSVASLFSQASMRWVGPKTSWDELALRMGLPTLSQCPPGENKDIIVTFTALLPENRIPTNRLAIREALANLSAAEQLRFAAIFDRPAAINPLRFGFEQG